MNTDYYKVFLTVMETKNISKAADILGYTQSGVSHIIHTLENQLKTTLFYRTRSGVMPTESAENFINEIRAIVDSESALFSKAALANQRQTNCINIATIQSFASLYLPLILKDFLELYPQVHFNITEKSKYHEIEELLTEGKVQCGFSSAPSQGNIDFNLLYEDSYCVVMPKNHPLTRSDSVTLSELSRYPFILPEEAVSNKELEYLISKMNVVKNLTSHTLDDSMILSMVEKDMGISIAPKRIVETFNDKVEVRSLDGPYIRDIGTLTESNVPQPSILKIFLDFSAEWVSAHIK